MRITAIATDLDDTLWSTRGVSTSAPDRGPSWPGRPRRSSRRGTERVVYVTGRPLWDVWPHASNHLGERVAGLDPQDAEHVSFIVAENGGVIVDVRDPHNQRIVWTAPPEGSARSGRPT